MSKNRHKTEDTPNTKTHGTQPVLISFIKTNKTVTNNQEKIIILQGKLCSIGCYPRSKQLGFSVLCVHSKLTKRNRQTYCDITQNVTTACPCIVLTILREHQKRYLRLYVRDIRYKRGFESWFVYWNQSMCITSVKTLSGVSSRRNFCDWTQLSLGRCWIRKPQRLYWW